MTAISASGCQGLECNMSQLNHAMVSGGYTALEGTTLPLAFCADVDPQSLPELAVSKLPRVPKSIPQSGRNRCWAAVLETAGLFLNVHVPQAELVARAERSRLVARNTCGNDPDAIELLELMALDSVVPNDSEDHALLLDVLHLSDGAGPLLESLESRRPVILVLHPTGKEAHAYLAYEAMTVAAAPARGLLWISAIDPRLPDMWPSVELTCAKVSRDLIVAMSVRVGTKAEAAERRQKMELRAATMR